MTGFTRLVERSLNDKERLLEKAELALEHALKSSLGPQLAAVSEKDAHAVAVLGELKLRQR